MGVLDESTRASKGVRRDEPKEKRAFAGLAVGILLYSLYQKNHHVWIGDFLSGHAGERGG